MHYKSDVKSNSFPEKSIWPFATGWLQATTLQTVHQAVTELFLYPSDFERSCSFRPTVS
jgi:hypothetical protein